MIDSRYDYEFDGGHVKPTEDGWLQVHHIPPHRHADAISLLFDGDAPLVNPTPLHPTPNSGAAFSPEPLLQRFLNP